MIASAKRAAGLSGAASSDEVRRSSFLGLHLVVGVAPFAAMPVMLALGAGLDGPHVALLAWAAAPALIAIGAAKTHDLHHSSILSAIVFAVLGAGTAALDGGVGSPAIAWLALPVADAALSGGRRTALVAAIASALGFAVVAALTLGGALPAAGGGAVTAASIIAALYGVAVALRAGAIVASSENTDRARRETIELISGEINDLVTRHGASGTTTYVSSAAPRLLGCTARELGGTGLFNRVHIADRPAFLRTLSEAARSDERLSAEIRVRRGASQSFVWFEMRAHRADRESGAQDVIAVFRDVTDRRSAHEALIAAREEAERASLAKTRFLANMSHELRTPLNAIIGFSEALSDEQLIRLSPERRADYAALIHRSGGHLLDVVNAILDMAKLESGAFGVLPEPCEFGPVVARSVEMMALKAETAGLEVIVDVAPGLPEIVADRRALTQILLNLLANAIKFTPRGGRVTVEVERCREGVALRVRDTGVGIAADAIERLGEPFFQADDGYGRRHEGAGLGLSVTRGLVKLHDGEMKVESVLGAGCCVTVTLPLEGPLSARQPKSNIEPGPAPARVSELTDARERKRA